MTRITIKAEELTPETRATLGIKIVPPVEQMSQRHLALGRVLKAIKDLSEEDVLWVFREARSAYRGQNEIETGDKYATPISQVIETVARHFGIGLVDITGHRRLTSFTIPRQVAMYLLWSSQVYTLKQIGKELGGRTPATISHGFDLIARAIQSDTRLNKKVDEIRKEIEGG